jgi:hypothetical protein
MDSWGQRTAIPVLFAYFKPLASIGHMPYWAADTGAVERLSGAVENDH